MRLIKMFGVAALAISAVMAFVGASSALAVLDSQDVICGENVELCPANKVLPQGAHVTALAKDSATEPLTLLGSINQLCEHSVALIEITSPGGHGRPLTGRTVSLDFLNCEPCTEITASVEPGGIQMTGATTWSLKAKGETTFKGCPFGVECKFGGEPTLTGTNTAAGLQFVANKAELKLTGGNSKVFCGEKGAWDATYKAAGHWLSTFDL